MDRLDREEKGPAVIFIGTTTKPNEIDESLLAPTRFEREFLFPLPNEKQRTRDIKEHLKTSKSHSADCIDVKSWAKDTKGFTETDIYSLIIYAIHGK